MDNKESDIYNPKESKSLGRNKERKPRECNIPKPMLNQVNQDENISLQNVHKMQDLSAAQFRGLLNANTYAI